MENQPILSIIVPSYNTSKYVDECLPTFIDERLFGKVKVLLIDDGATDDTSEKIKPYVDKYPQLFEFYHKENGGHGSVINYAVHKLIKTKYFKVVDGDDWVDSDELLKLVSKLYENNADLVVTDFTCCYPLKNKLNCSFHGGDEKLCTSYDLTIHSITYSTEIFVNNNILLSERVFYEDSEYNFIPLFYVEKFLYFSFNVYKYRLGTSTQSVSYQSQVNHRNDADVVFNRLADIYNSPQIKQRIDLQLYCIGILSYFILGRIKIISKTSKNFKHFCQQINEYLLFINNIDRNLLSKVKKSRKLAKLMGLFNFKMSYFIKGIL